MRVHFITFGCKVNLCETEALKSEFLNDGFEVTELPSHAEVFVINSCTVTAVSDKKTRQTLNTLRKDYPQATIVLTGCYPQAFQEQANAMQSVDIVTGTKDRKAIVSLVRDYLEHHHRVVSIEDYSPNDTFEPLPIGDFQTKTRGFVKVQDGCNRFCTYCIIPYARGRLRSKPLGDVKREVGALVASGHKEVVLVGINLMFYGVEYGIRLVDVVEACASVQGVERIRLGSLEPEVLTDDDLLRLSKVKQFCPQFHLSLQSGCDKTLRAMNRAYSSNEYYALVTKIREVFPNCAITTDVMVGFPDETVEDFQESLTFVEKVGFSKLHVFPYSRRSGTPADTMPNQVSKAEKRMRAKLMAEVGKRSQEDFLKLQVGTVAPVLFELENEDGYYHGYTPNYTLVKVPRKNLEKSLRKSIFCVRIEEYKDEYCIGSIVLDS